MMHRGIAGLVIAATGVAGLAGCVIQDRTSPGVGLRNDTDVVLTVERLLQDGKRQTIATLEPGGLSLASDPGLVDRKCVEDVGLRAVDSAGHLMATLGAACDGDTWLIQADGKSSIMGLNGTTTEVRP